MDKYKLLKYVGSIQQVAYVRRMECLEGRAAGMCTTQVKNGDISFLVMEDKGLDIATLEYRGINLNFLSKPGLIGRNSFDTHGLEALRSIMGGLFFTCGLENICAPYQKDNKEYPMHGRIRTTPAEHVCTDAFWHDGAYIMQISGEVREAELFGENMVLRRKISTIYGKNEINIQDEVENQSYREEPMMLMYHCNFGYPFLTESCRLILPSKKVTPREEWSGKHLDNWDKMDAPKDQQEEYVYIHDLAADEEGHTFAAIVNDTLGFGVKIDFNKKQLPYFMEWKSVASGDYTIGLEPSNSSVYGRKYHEDQNSLHTLMPGEKEVITWKFSVINEKEILEAEKRCQALLMEEGKNEAI